MSFADKAVDALREAGGRITPQRQLIIETLTRAHNQLDAEKLYRAVRRQDQSVSLATVYRTLSALEALGLIRTRYISSDHERKYIETVSPRYHFTCKNCHKVMSFTTSLVDDLKRELEHTLNVEVTNACVCIDGLCPDCLERRK